MPEVIIVLILIASIAWVAVTVRRTNRLLKEAALDQAWREVLNDPEYEVRRRYEERKRVQDQARAAAAISQIAAQYPSHRIGARSH